MAGPQKYLERVRFGDFEFDRRTGDLKREGSVLRLQPQPAKVFGVLLSRAGEVVTRQELAEQIWGTETFVDYERGLNYAIRQIRTALADDADHPRFLETLPRRGYRFIGEIEESAPPAGTVVLQEEPEPEMVQAKKPGPVGRRNWHWALLAAICTVLVTLAAIGYFQSMRAPSMLAPIQSVAVLPLVNLSSDPSQEYFSDGLTDELITEMAQIANLRVISRASAVRFKGSRKGAPEIGRELGVDAIVEGSVERNGSRVRIRAQLIHTPTDRHLWAQSYDRDVGDVLALERELARDIAEQVGHSIAQRKASPVRKVSGPAHEDYLKGRYYWNKRTAAGLQKGIEHFQRAIDQDPNHAPAYTGLADSYIMLANWGFTSPAEAYVKAKAAATQALQLDPQLAEAHTSLAYVTLLYDWNWEGAEAGFRRAIALNTNYTSAHHFYSILLMTAGRQAEAIQEIRRAQELDPLSLIVNDVVGWIYYEGRQYDLAIEQYERTLEMDQSYTPALLDLGTAHLRKGEYAQARSVFERVRSSGGEGGVVMSGVAQVHALSGQHDEARSVLRKLEASPEKFISSWDLALIYAALKERDKAIALLEKAANEHVGWVVRLGVDPALDSLQGESKFEELKRRVRIPIAASLPSTPGNSSGTPRS